jgi:ABC-2 type transport system ATP-binding protein
VQILCNDIIMIDAGKIVFANTMEAFSNYVEPHSVLVQMNNLPASGELLKIEGVTKVEFLNERQARLFFNGDQDVTERIIEESVRKGWRLREIGLDKSSIDEIFAQLSNKSK